jgi:hypothetical protein
MMEKFNMKIIIIGFSMLLMLAVFANAEKQTSERPSNSYNLKASLVNQDPDPVEPGNYVDVRFKLDNEGTEEARDVEVEILPEYPFSLYSGNSLRKIGTLESRQKGDTGVVIKYRLRVDEKAIEGENEIRMRYKVENNGWIEPDEFLIDIQTQDAILAVESIISTSSIIPGESSLLKIRIKNMADSLLNNIKVNLDLGSVPLIPLGSTNEKTLYQLDAKESYDVEFNLIAEPDAESKIYKVPLQLEYFDELGTKYIKNQTIGITIGAKPDISITLDDSEIFQSGKAGEIVIKVVNKGVTDIKFMNLELMSSDDYRTLSNSEAYLGNIDSDDFETADFEVFVEKTKDKSIKIPIEIEYMDANNNDYNNKLSLDLNLYSGSEAKKLGLENGNKFGGVIIVIIIVAAGLYLYRRKRKKKK